MAQGSHRYACGVPKDICTGGNKPLSAGMKNFNGKTHSSRSEAFGCYKHYLISQGYKQVGPKEFESPEGPVMVLAKKSKFGTDLRPGKEGTRNMPESGCGVII